MSPFLLKFSPAKACLQPAGRCALLGAGCFPPGVPHAMGKELIRLVLCSAWSTAAGSSRPAPLQTLQLLLTCCTTWPFAPEVNTHWAQLSNLDTALFCVTCASPSVAALSGAERSRLKACLSFAGRGASDLAAWQQASSVLVALVQALLPAEGPEGMLNEADEQRLGKSALLQSMIAS